MFFKLTGPMKTIAAQQKHFEQLLASIQPGQELIDLIVFLHFAFVVFVVLGGLLVLRWPRAAWVHIPAVAWGALVEFTGWICPLTLLENSLRCARERAATRAISSHTTFCLSCIRTG